MLNFISDGQTLLLILALLYFAECLIWVKKQSVAFVPNWGRGWRLATPISWLGNANGAMLILNPLPPPGRVFLSHLLPISISPSGVCAFNSQTLASGSRSTTQTGEFVPFSAITKVATDGSYLLINKQKFAKCATPKQAKALAGIVERTAGAKVSKREALVKSWLAEQFDVAEATRLRSESEKEIDSVRFACSLFLVFLFVGAPLLVSFFGLEQMILPIAGAMVMFAVWIAIKFFWAHRRFYPAESLERLENLLKMVLCPPVSLRAADVLTKNLLARFSPVAVAGVLEGPGEQQFVRAFVLDLQHPLKHEIADAKAIETIDWMNAQQLQLCLSLIEHVDRFNGVLGPPEREGGSVSYCPRCGVQFVVDEGECPDCPGVELVAFSDHEFNAARSASRGNSAH
ncbi:MAG TPA: hypothetical protein VFM63_08305 [Pyrinomonadaceae bacterium]|nr:hypothetical protein [Pyrinomonadaceae bacterium]